MNNEAHLSIGDFKDIGGGYITFGAYPQNKKSWKIKIVGLFDQKRKYYLGSDDCMYVELVYEKNCKKKCYYKVEPIKWKVLRREDDAVFVVADNILDEHCFYDWREKSDYYAESEMLKFLNGEFYDRAFSDGQKEKIITTKLNCCKISDTWEDVRDKVFLLDPKDAERYLNSNEARKRALTEFAAVQFGGASARWFLLMNDIQAGSPLIVEDTGNIFEYPSGYYNDIPKGVVPALQLKP